MGSTFVSLGAEKSTKRRCVTADFNHGKSDQLLSFNPKTAAAYCQFPLKKEHTDFTQEETDRLVQEVQARNHNLFIATLIKSNVLITSPM